MAGARRSSRAKAEDPPAADDAPPAEDAAPPTEAATEAEAEPAAAPAEPEAPATEAEAPVAQEWDALGPDCGAWPADLRPAPLLAVARVPSAIPASDVGAALKAAGLDVLRADSEWEPKADGGGAAEGGGDGDGGGADGGDKKKGGVRKARTVYVRLAPPADPAADVYAAADAAVATLPKAPSGGDRVVTVGTGTPHAAACTVVGAAKAKEGGAPLEVTLFVDNAPDAWFEGGDAASLASAVAAHGAVVRAAAPPNEAGQPKGYVIFEFATPAGAGRAKAALDAAEKEAREAAKAAAKEAAAVGAAAEGGGDAAAKDAAAARARAPRVPRGEWAHPASAVAQWSRVLYVQGLPAALTPAGESPDNAKTLAAAVAGFGAVDTAHAPRGKGGAARGFAFIEFKASAGADAAYRALVEGGDGGPLGPGVRASFSNPCKSRDAPLGGGKRPGEGGGGDRARAGGGDRKRGRDGDRGGRDRGDRGGGGRDRDRDRRGWGGRDDRRGGGGGGGWGGGRDDRGWGRDDRGWGGGRDDRGRYDDRGGWRAPPPPRPDDRWGPPPPARADWRGGGGGGGYGPPPPAHQAPYGGGGGGGGWGGGGGYGQAPPPPAYTYPPQQYQQQQAPPPSHHHHQQPEGGYDDPYKRRRW